MSNTNGRRRSSDESRFATLDSVRDDSTSRDACTANERKLCFFVLFFLSFRWLRLYNVCKPTRHDTSRIRQLLLGTKKESKKKIKLCFARGEMFRPYLVHRCALSFLSQRGTPRPPDRDDWRTERARGRRTRLNCKCTHCMFCSNDHVQCCGFNILCNYL